MNSPAFASPLSVASAVHTHGYASALTSGTRPTTRLSSKPQGRRCKVSMGIDLRDNATKEKEIAEAQLQARTDPAPGPYAYFAEQVNGRAAMMGFIIGLGVEITSGTTIVQQIQLIASNLAQQGFLWLAPFIELFTRKLEGL